MAQLRDIKRRIGAVKNTRQITRAMKMVAGARLNRAMEGAVNARPYQQALERTIRRIAGRAGPDLSHRLLRAHDRVERVLLVVVGTDRGLCGSFNHALFRAVERFAGRHREQGRELALRTYGKKARLYFSRRGYPIEDSVTELDHDDWAGPARRLADAMAAAYESAEHHEVWVAFNRFGSVMTQTPTIERFLPIEVDPAGPEGSMVDYRYEPSGQVLLDTLLPLALQVGIQQVFLETEAGEQASRMTAMDAATRNAGELIDRLTLDYNRARQAAITKEIIEIVSGAEAL